MRNPNTDPKTVKSINTKSAAARAAAAATGTAANSAATTANTAAKAMTAREINAAFKKNHEIFENNQDKVRHAIIMTRSYVGKYLKELGYGMHLAIEKGESGKLYAKINIHYIGMSLLGYSDKEIIAMVSDDNYVGCITYLEISDGKIYIKIYDSEKGWVYAKTEIEKIICRHYCQMNNVFDFDKYKVARVEEEPKFEVVSRKKKK